MTVCAKEKRKTWAKKTWRMVTLERSRMTFFMRCLFVICWTCGPHSDKSEECFFWYVTPCSLVLPSFPPVDVACWFTGNLIEAITHWQLTSIETAALQFDAECNTLRFGTPTNEYCGVLSGDVRTASSGRFTVSLLSAVRHADTNIHFDSLETQKSGRNSAKWKGLL